jgi:uncharacterized membrane protein YkvI
MHTTHNRLASWLPPKDSVAYGLLSGYLPVLLLALLMILLPIVISLSASKFMKLKSHSEVDLYVFKWHFGQFTALSALLLLLLFVIELATAQQCYSQPRSASIELYTCFDVLCSICASSELHDSSSTHNACRY